ncbi:MAG: PAS domain S-box protein [Desulfobacteria bacterium]
MHDKQANSTANFGRWIDIADSKDMSGSLMVNASPMESYINGIAFSDLEGNLAYVNDSFLKLWGYGDEKEVFGKAIASFWKTEEKFNEIVNVLRTKGNWRGKLVAKRKDGSLKDVQLSATMVTGENGRSFCMMGSFMDVTERRRLEEKLKKREAALEARTNEVEEVNSALRVLLKQRDQDKAELAGQMLLNVKKLVVPYLEKLKKHLSGTKQLGYLSILESNLNDIVSPFAYKLSLKYSTLTPTEIQIARFVKRGKVSREMAELLNVSERTIESHRQKIRLKIGIKNNGANLRSQLMGIKDY